MTDSRCRCTGSNPTTLSVQRDPTRGRRDPTPQLGQGSAAAEKNDRDTSESTTSGEGNVGDVSRNGREPLQQHSIQRVDVLRAANTCDRSALPARAGEFVGTSPEGHSSRAPIASPHTPHGSLAPVHADLSVRWRGPRTRRRNPVAGRSSGTVEEIAVVAETVRTLRQQRFQVVIGKNIRDERL